MKIDELLKESKIKYQKLKEVAEIGTGCSNRQDAIENGNYPFYVRSKEIQRIDTFEFDEEAIIIPGEGGIGDIFHYVNGKYALHQRAYRIHFFDDKINVKFAYYYLINYFKSFILTKAVNATVTSIRKPMIEDFEIPCLPIGRQQAIVNILDKFTQLEAELEAELEARKKQYEYYRNELVVNDKWLMVSLGEIGTFVRGKRFVKNDILSEGTPCIHYGEMYTYYKIWANETKSYLDQNLAKNLRVAHTNDVIIVAAGETVEDIGNAVAWLGESDVVFHDACFAFSHKENPKYISYFMQTEHFRSQIKRYVTSSKVSAINAAGLSKAKIPLPPLEEQSRIVSILDKFDKLVNDISEGLPAEIKMRRQQYEYYRNKLLTFV